MVGAANSHPDSGLAVLATNLSDDAMSVADQHHVADLWLILLVH
jgi:hypothetical protein